MKKHILASLLLSTVLLSNVSGPALVLAEDTDSQIAAQESKINEIAAAQATTQSQVDALQAQVEALQAEQSQLAAESDKLKQESEALIAEIQKLSADIVSRDAALKEQARSAQVDGSASSYINTVLDSKSIADAISRVNAMRQIIAANNRMLEQQKADKKAIAEKQKANQDAINTVDANRQKLEDNAQVLQAQEAQLKVAQLNLAAEKATAEGEKNRLLEEKAAAEAAAAAAAAQQAAYAQQQADLAARQQQTPPVVIPPASGGGSTGGGGAPANAGFDASSYPIGECTWGVKTMVSWVGPFWGNAQDWAASARAEGFRVDTTPAVGAIAVWSGANGYGGGYGHVALVTEVQSETSIQVLESNYMGNRYVGNFRGWFNPVADGVTWYIHAN